MRRGGLLGLKWEHINLGNTPSTFTIDGGGWQVPPGWLLIERSKSGKPRALPLSSKARSVLSALHRDELRGRFVFQNAKTGVNSSDVKTSFTGACRDAGLDNLTFHDLRHTWSTRAAECGVPESVRRDILGHAATTITGSYTHSSPAAMEMAMEAAANYSRGNIFFAHGKITAVRLRTAVKSR